VRRRVAVDYHEALNLGGLSFVITHSLVVVLLELGEHP
jgi:hypothetical protein